MNRFQQKIKMQIVLLVFLCKSLKINAIKVCGEKNKIVGYFIKNKNFKMLEKKDFHQITLWSPTLT